MYENGVCEPKNDPQTKLSLFAYREKCIENLINNNTHTNGANNNADLA